MADIVKGFREVVQDLLVPELKAVQVELRYLKEGQQELNKRIEMLQQEMNKRFEAMDKRFEAVDKRIEMLEKRMYAVEVGLEKILTKLDLNEKVTKHDVMIEELSKQMKNLENIILLKIKASPEVQANV